MKKLPLLIPLLILSSALVGCAPFEYRSKIQVGAASFDLPKDAKGDYMQVSIPVQLTNGSFATASMVVSNFTFKMNPEVLDKATQHDLAIINAVGEQVGNAVQKGVEAAKKGTVAP